MEKENRLNIEWWRFNRQHLEVHQPLTLFFRLNLFSLLRSETFITRRQEIGSVFIATIHCGSVFRNYMVGARAVCVCTNRTNLNRSRFVYTSHIFCCPGVFPL